MITVKTMEQMSFSYRELRLTNAPLPVSIRESFFVCHKARKLEDTSASHSTIWPAPLAKLWLKNMQVSA
jgi:hypothetical protein